MAYDGTDFSGWAVQPGRRTVAGVLLAELARLFTSPTGLVVAGRTDAGVHATGQVAHLDVPAAEWAAIGDSLIRRLARMLPRDVRVTAAAPVPSTFDARFSALWRRYEYRVTDAPWGADPLRARDTLAWPRPLDLGALRAAAAGLIGEHDFAAYCRRKEHGTTVRRLTRLDWRREPAEAPCRDEYAGDEYAGPAGVLVAVVEADAFCQAMVRSLVGALLVVGEGRRPVPWPAGLLQRRVRADEVPVAPAYGLTLVAVGYPAEEEYGLRATVTRARRPAPE